MKDSAFSWEKRLSKIHPSAGTFSPFWDFRCNDGKIHYTVDPQSVPGEWLDISEPSNVFEVPEIWYGVEKFDNPNLDSIPWHQMDFIQTLWEKYSDKPILRVFEVCCGICPHGSILAKKGISVVGVDSSDGMVRAVTTRAKAENLPIEAYKRDVFQFSIPGDSPDGALLLGNTFPLARNNKTDNGALVSQLRSVGAFMRKNTLFIIDCGNPEPRPFVREYAMDRPRTVNLGFAEVTLTNRVFPTDVETMATPCVTGYHVQYPSGRVRLEYKGAYNFVSAQHLAALVELSQVFILEAFHHWGNPDGGLVRGGGPYVAVLRRI